MAERGNPSVYLYNFYAWDLQVCPMLIYLLLLLLTVVTTLNVLHMLFSALWGYSFAHTVVCCTCTFVTGQSFFFFFLVVLRTVRTYSVKTDVDNATVCKHSICSWFAGLCKDGQQVSVNTSLLTSDQEALTCWPARQFTSLPVCSFCILFVTIHFLY